MGTNILITTIGRRGTLTKIFKEELHKIGGKVIVTDNSSLAPALYQADDYYLTPRIDAPNYIDRILDICQKEDIKVIIPLLEQGFSILGQARDTFKQVGVELLLSSSKVFNLCKDKYNLYNYFREHEIATPETFLVEQLQEKNVSFPLFIKPRSGQGSQDTFIAKDRRGLDYFIDHMEEIVIQEYIQGTEYTIDTLSDLAGNLLSAVPRKRIEVRAGEVSKAVTVKEERLIKWAKEIIEGLGIVGPANLQAIITLEDEIKFIEVNPRFGGGVPLSYQAGVNYPKLITEMINGKDIEPFIGDFKEGLAMLRYDTPLFKAVGHES
ncbi:carbamoylphosphate synthase large subunit [Halobacteroides halobius DSM 5150]|uniref:Carbamoylphosphate synthase large subunit n=1 Tax=Halobacteroides halobius (strain ATCC 35273 / DSM 5150 / MD-1) TaxID=748449 RepID=L0KC38_HALHC|nr:ATP-grasp domain-containing protein [Halobacteroides halobius]AGB42120.1 carbamoylphosphate synthase large subunit [Halobacteroides halobius DSM 5150]